MSSSVCSAVDRKKVIIAGSRGFDNYPLMVKVLVEYFVKEKLSPNDIEVISGTANGADKLGERFAEASNVKLTRMPADWVNNKRSAGHIRNAEMADYAKENGVCFIFWDGESKGSEGMAKVAKKKGLEVIMVNYVLKLVETKN